jgi:hypothetical protein
MGASEKIDALVLQHGGWKEIPNSELYDLLQDIREDLVNMAKLGADHIPNTNLGIEVRRRSIADLKWLAKYFLWDAMSVSENGELPITENIFLDPQYDVFADLFVKKDPSVTLLNASPVKTRLLLWPRGGAKSSYDAVDTVQWVLAYPSIRILFLTGEASLSVGFISEIKGFFTLREDSPSLMNLFFPEHCCLRKDMGAGNIFTTPVYKAKKTGRKEPTVRASSVGKTKAGWRFEVIKADDAVSDKNTETLEQCTSVSEKLFLAEKLLMPGGFYKDYVGTRYAEEDHYGVLLEKYLTTGDIETVSGTGWTLTRNKTYNIDILIGKACQIKPEVEERLRREGRPVNYIEAGEDGCILLLPTKQPYPWLMGEFANNEKVFEGQLNQNPRVSSQRGFDRISLIKATIPFNMLPRSGPVSQFWDLSFSQKKGTDYCVGSSVMWGEEEVCDPQGKKTGFRKTVGYVRKLIRDRFNPFTAAQAIVQMVAEERPFVLGIEDAGGSKNLEPAIHAEAYKTQDSHIIAVCTHIQWVTPSNQFDAKRIRMGSLIPWIEEGRMKFASFCMEPKYPTLDVMYEEFIRCLSSHHHDDIPDNLGYQPMYAPQATQAMVENKTDMFYVVDRQGWGDIYNEGFSPNDGSVFTLGEDGSITPYTRTQPTRYSLGEDGRLVAIDAPNPIPVSFDDWIPEQDTKAENPYGLDNVLGVGIFG